jgi:hypothetical protein
MITLVPMSLQPARRASMPGRRLAGGRQPRGMMPPSITLPEERVRSNFPVRSRERRQGPGTRMGLSCRSVDPPDFASPENSFRWSSQIRQPVRVRSDEPRGSGMNFCVQQFESLVGCGGVGAMAIDRGSRRLPSPRSSHRQRIPWRERRGFSRLIRSSVHALIPVSFFEQMPFRFFLMLAEKIR